MNQAETATQPDYTSKVPKYAFANTLTLSAELYYNGITRGATLEGPDAVIDEEPAWPDVGHATGAVLWREEIRVGLQAAQQYTECAQIYNPIHTEPSVAKAAGLPGIILHGSATKAMSLSAVIDRSFGGDAARITRLCGQLRGMVLMDTTIAVEALAEAVVAGEKRVLFRTLTEDGKGAIRNGIVCGSA
jgi:acyl dehydratase